MLKAIRIVMTILMSAAILLCGGAKVCVAEQEIFETLQRRLVSEGHDPDWVARIYGERQIALDLTTASVFFTYRESRLNYDQFASAESIATARRYMVQYEEALQTAEVVYGVDKSVITAILLVETRLGAYRGKKPVIDTLSTLSVLDEPAVRELLWERVAGETERGTFDARVASRARWAFRELKAFLTHTRTHGIDPLAMVGSMAGAIGICQFLPSNVAAYGADGNGDGRVDLFEHADAIASVARYLQKNGWRPGIDDTQGGRVILRYNNSRPYRDIVLKVSRLLQGP